ncbi:hypothetical protein AVEN_72577-1, partial [Araneus ventricosus]
VYSSWKGRSNSGNPRPTFEVPYLCVQPNSYRAATHGPFHLIPSAEDMEKRRQGAHCFIEKASRPFFRHGTSS